MKDLLVTKLHVRYMFESELEERRVTMYVPTLYGWVVLASFILPLVMSKGRAGESINA